MWGDLLQRKTKQMIHGRIQTDAEESKAKKQKECLFDMQVFDIILERFREAC
jgi:hypothetical protein